MMAFEATIGCQAATRGLIFNFQALITVKIILPRILVEKELNIIQKSLDITTNSLNQ